MKTMTSLVIAAALALSVFATSAAASLNASVTGKIRGVAGGDEQTGAGSDPITSVYSSSDDPSAIPNRFQGRATAAMGSLGAGTSINVEEHPGYLSHYYPTWRDAEVTAYAMFRDRWLFMDEPLDTPGRLRMTFTFDGTTHGEANGASINPTGRFQLDLSSEAEHGNTHDLYSYNSTDLRWADESVTVELDFLYGRTVFIRGSLFTLARFASDRDAAFYSGSGGTDFLNTAELTTLQVLDTEGNWTSDFLFQTESGALYPFQSSPPTHPPSTPAPIPLPPAAWSALVVLILLGAGASWRDRQRADERSCVQA